ncbi:MAG: hypothetical protein EP330_20530 [Deltaproteobacteria bacterium]|nr:MAG: hypothetical protein EP330_20530 [Deltaproteobacteria bacterium]
MSGGKSFAPAPAAEKTDEIPQTEEVEADLRGNAAVAADVEQTADDEGGSWFSSLWGGGDQDQDPGDDDMAAKIEALAGESEDKQLAQLQEWLTDGGWFDTVSSEETEAAKALLSRMSEEGRAKFAAIDGGKLADQLLDNPGGTPWWADPIGALSDDFSGTLKKAKEDASAVWDATKDVVDAVVHGEEVGLNLDLAQAAAGGDLGGVKLDTAQDHTLDVDGDLSAGRMTVKLANLGIESIDATVDGAKVTSGRGSVNALKVTVDVPDQENAQTSLDVEAGVIDFQDLGVNVADPFLQVAIPRLVVMAIELHAARAAIDPAELSEGAGAEEALRDVVGEQLTFFGRDLLAPLAKAAQTVDDAAALGDGIASAAATGGLDVDASFDKLHLPGGAKVTSQAEDGSTVESEVKELSVDSFAMTLEAKERLGLLEEELSELKNAPQGMVDKKRVEWLEAEIPKLRADAARKNELDAKKASGTLTPDENQEWVELDRSLMAGVLSVSIGSISVSGASHGTDEVDKLELTDISAEVSGLAVTPNAQPATSKREEVDALLGIEKEAPKAAKGDIGDLSVKSTIGSATVEGARTSYGNVDSVTATGTEVTAATDLIGVKTDVAATGIDAKGATADTASATGVDVVARGMGTDVGGRIGAVAASGVAHESGASASSVQANGIVFDADVTSSTLRSGSVKEATASDVDYDDGTHKVHANEISAGDIAATGASSSGANSLDVGDVGASGVSYQGGGHDVRLDSAQATDIGLTGVTKTGAASVDVGGGSASGVSYQGGGHEVAVDAASVSGVSATGVTTSGAKTASVDGAGATGLSYKGGGHEAGASSVSVSGVSANGVTTSGASSASVDSAGATGLSYKGGGHEVEASSANVSGVSATGVTTSGAKTASVGSGSVNDVHYSGGGHEVDVAGAKIEGVSASGVSTSGADSVDVRSASASGISHQGGGTSTSVASVEANGVHGKGVTTSGASEVVIDSAGVGAVKHDGDQDVSLGGASASGITLTDVSSDGTGKASVDHAHAENLDTKGSMGNGHVGSVDVEGLDATRDANGTVATIDGANVEDIRGGKGTMSGSVDSVQVGRSGVALDADNNLEGVAVDGLDVNGIHVELLHMPMNEVASGASGPAVDPGQFTAAPFANANGQFSARIPVANGGAFTVSAVAQNGLIPLSELDIEFEGGLLGNIAAGLASVKVKEGVGIVAKAGPVTVKVAASVNDYDGLLSKKQGGGKKGSVALQPLIEGLQNGDVSTEVDEAEMQSLQDKIDENVQTLSETGWGFGVDAGAITINTSSLSVGNGRLGNDQGSVTLDNGGNAQANRFTIQGTLGEGLGIGAHQINASSAHAILPTGDHVSLESVGLRGLDVTITQPLSTSRTILVDVEGTKVRSIRLGDTSRLG